MTRVKRGTIAHKRRKNLLKYTKGYHWGRKSKYRAAKEALLHAWTHAFRGRKEKKRNFRRLWTIQINAACRERNITYNKFINGLKKKGVALDRKILAEIANKHTDIFDQLVEIAKS